jgi:hypothetical protein
MHPVGPYYTDILWCTVRKALSWDIVIANYTFNMHEVSAVYFTSGVPRNFFGGGFTPGIFSRGDQQIQLRAEGRENGDLGTVAP